MSKYETQFQQILSHLFNPEPNGQNFSIFNPSRYFQQKEDKVNHAQRINAAFLICLAGKSNPHYQKALRFLNKEGKSENWGFVAGFYLKGLELIPKEINKVGQEDFEFSINLKSLLEHLSGHHTSNDKDENIEKIWSVFFPEGLGLRQKKDKKIELLREKRRINITEFQSHPIVNPVREIVFTSNILLTVPAKSEDINGLSIHPDLRTHLKLMEDEKQKFWYDHPIQMGVKPEKNEVIYGLKALNHSVGSEKSYGTCNKDDKLTCILSVSVSHDGLHNIARKYLEGELIKSEDLNNLDIYAFTETDTRKIIDQILVPAADHFLDHHNTKEYLQVFGVDGEYGRHYSFLKAITAFWNIFVDDEARATFKIDLDQVFPQQQLLAETDKSAFTHFKTPLWGAIGIDSNGEQVELGLIAGALVNEKDIHKSLFTPDVKFPNADITYDEYIFFSALPQSISTEAEMMTKYDTSILDGKKACIQRIHVTGGTNGILIDSLIKYRPFVPSFIARAEDQAYIMSVLIKPGSKLVYLHKDGLIMRHDKEAFAQDAIEAAYIGKLVGDYNRILLFSYYAALLSEKVSSIKEILDPFTGCFISKIPSTVVYLRFALKAASFFAKGQLEQGVAFINNGAKRISEVMQFCLGKNNEMKRLLEKERKGWEIYYDILAVIQKTLNSEDPFAISLKKKAVEHQLVGKEQIN
jgi:hypothetical protein